MWSGNHEGYDGIGVLVNELRHKLVESRRVSDRVMSIAKLDEEEVERVI